MADENQQSGNKILSPEDENEIEELIECCVIPLDDEGKETKGIIGKLKQHAANHPGDVLMVGATAATGAVIAIPYAAAIANGANPDAIMLSLHDMCGTFPPVSGIADVMSAVSDLGSNPALNATLASGVIVLDKLAGRKWVKSIREAISHNNIPPAMQGFAGKFANSIENGLASATTALMITAPTMLHPIAHSLSLGAYDMLDNWKLAVEIMRNSGMSDDPSNISVIYAAPTIFNAFSHHMGCMLALLANNIAGVLPLQNLIGKEKAGEALSAASEQDNAEVDEGADIKSAEEMLSVHKVSNSRN